MFEFTNKVVVITGGARGIGKCIKETFEALGAKTCIIDIIDNSYFTGDISDEKVLREFVNKVLSEHKKIDYLINNACPISKGISNCSYDEFNYALKVGISAPFMLTKLFLNHFNEDSVIINISSSRDRMSQPETESYSASKGGISALTHALAISLAGKVRVNSISPGWIDNYNQELSNEDKLQHPVRRVGTPEDIANTVLFLCSNKSSFITGENICVDGGMTKQMIYHNDFNWKLENK